MEQNNELWIDSRQQLPAPFTVVACKYTPDSPDPRNDTELHWGYVNADGKWMGRNWQNHQIEWLNEEAYAALKAKADRYEKALKEALDALEDCYDVTMLSVDGSTKQDLAIVSIRAALSDSEKGGEE